MKPVDGHARLAGIRCFRGLALTMISILAACNSAGDVYSPKEWRDLFKKSGGWAPLPFPDSKYRIGSIIEVKEDGTIRWIDHLESCKFPAEVLAAEPSEFPRITFEKKRELSAKALIDIEGIEAGPEFSKVSKALLEVQDHGGDALRLIRLRIWLETPENREKVFPQCMEELLKPNHYLVTEAFRVSRGQYTLYDQSDTAIALRAPALGSLLKFEPEVRHSVTADGKLIIDHPVYFAVRMAVRIGNGWQVLGSDAEPVVTADDEIGEIFMRLSGE